MDLGLKGKRALVLGASSGLGKAIAEQLVKEGAKVAISARHENTLKGTAQNIGAHATLVCDLLKPRAGTELVEKANQVLGGIDILVTNAGGPPKGEFDEISDEDWQKGFQSLWLSVVDTVQAALPQMRERNWGRVLLITSTAAREPIAGLSVSNGLRAGLLGLMKSLSREVAHQGITVNAILPGYTKTERLVELGIAEDKITAQIPAGRLGSPEELGALAAFLASEKAAYITGQAIAIDGGLIRGV